MQNPNYLTVQQFVNKHLAFNVEPIEYFGIVASAKSGYVLLSDEVEIPADLKHRLLAIQKYRKSAHIEMTGMDYPRLPNHKAEQNKQA
jgi:hypothetical protein